jgi:hypothetical protein
MSSGWIVPIIWALIFASGCAQSGTEKPYGTPGSAVRPTSAGNVVYIIDGKVQNATPGYYNFGFKYDKLNTTTDEERVSQYLILKNLMPPDCNNGMNILKSGRTENGYAWIKFKCR